jgi:monoamine oxidase
MLMWFYTQAWFKLQSDIAKVAFKAVGGNQSIPDAMAASLGDAVYLGKRVVGIRDGSDAIEVVCDDDSMFSAKRVICSMPIPTMRWLKFDPILPSAKAKAIATVPVMRVTKTIMIPKKPFWEEDGFSPAMWTDGDAGEVRSLREGADPKKITCLMAWGRGFLADKLDSFDEKEAIARVIAAYEQIRPAAKGQLKGVAFKSWQLDPFAGGDWVVWAPAGRMHFCGEHTALSNRGMEGAMESGERAALETLALL